MRRRPRLKKVLNVLRSEMPRLRQDYDVRSLALFGPYARDKAKRADRLDILVDYEVVPGFFKFFDLEEDLTKLVGVEAHLVSKGGPKGEDPQRILNESVAV
jgi:predicted nucleotidyltransferase